MDRLNFLIENYKLPFILCLVGIVLIVGGVITSGLLKPPEKKEFPKSSIVLAKESQRAVKVDVSGSVITPGVYDLTGEPRVEDAIKAAGGFSEDASAEFIAKQLNLSQKVTDGTKIYIPKKGESISSQILATTNSQSVLVNINIASSGDLEGLPGVGSVTATKIIEGRPYQDITELATRKIISKTVFEKIKEKISVN